MFRFETFGRESDYPCETATVDDDFFPIPLRKLLKAFEVSQETIRLEWTEYLQWVQTTAEQLSQAWIEVLGSKTCMMSENGKVVTDFPNDFIRKLNRRLKTLRQLRTMWEEPDWDVLTITYLK